MFFSLSPLPEQVAQHDPLKLTDSLTIFSWYTLLSICTRTPTATIMAQNILHHLCFLGSACFCLWSAPSQQNCFNMASGGISVLHQMLCKHIILCHKPKHCLEGEILENIKTWPQHVVMWCSLAVTCSRVSDGQKWVESWVDWAEFITGVNFNFELICNREVETRNGHIATYDTACPEERLFTAANAGVCSLKCCDYVECREKLWRRDFKGDT